MFQVTTLKMLFITYVDFCPIVNIIFNYQNLENKPQIKILNSVTTVNILIYFLRVAYPSGQLSIYLYLHLYKIRIMLNIFHNLLFY